jgi:hypothetical protein
MLRSVLVLLIVCGVAATAEAAKVTRFVVTCLDRQEATDDDVYLAGTRDGQPVPWGKGHQAGTSVGNSIDLNDDKDADDEDERTLKLDDKSLAEMNFNNSLEIAVKEKDVTAEQLLGMVKITPDDGMKTIFLRGGEGDNLFEYRIEYTVEK